MLVVQGRIKKTVFLPTFHRGCTWFWGCSESAGPSWESLWSHWRNKWPLVLEFLSPHSCALQSWFCKVWAPRWWLNMADQSSSDISSMVFLELWHSKVVGLKWGFPLSWKILPKCVNFNVKFMWVQSPLSSVNFVASLRFLGDSAECCRVV